MATKTRGKGEGSLYKDARGLWTAVIELPPRDGKRRRKTIRSRDKATVMDRLRETQRELAERGDLPTADQTVAQWFGYWYSQIVLKEVRPKTAGGYRSIIDRHVIPEIGTLRLARVTPTSIRRVTDRIINNGGAASSALKAHQVMSSAFEAALREGRISRNPCKLMAAPRKNVTKLETLTRTEAKQIIDYVAADREYGARWAMALLTGARRGEILGLERDRITDVIDLSWQLQRLSVGQRTSTGKIGEPVVPNDYEYRHLYGGYYLTRPKSRAGWRIIPLVEPLKSILELHMDANPDGQFGLVFTRNQRPVDPDYDSKLWTRVLAASGIQKHVRLHDLRHTAVDLLYAAGLPEETIIRIVGHSAVSMTRAYASRDIDRLRAGMEKFSDYFTRPDDSRSGTPEAISG
jgi:integrase